MKDVLGNKRAIIIFTLPSVLMFTVIMILPIFASFYFSLHNWDGLGTMEFIGLTNYIKLFIKNSNNFYLTVRNTLIIAGLSAFVQVPLALILALVLNSGIKGEGFFRTVYFIPVVISVSAIAQLFLKIYNYDYGLLNEILSNIGLGDMRKAWLYDESTALWAAFVPIVWQYIGYHMLILYAGIKAIPGEITESAKIDGASKVQTSLYITIPMIKPMLEVSVTLAVIGALKIFDMMFILTSNGEPLGKTMVQTGLMYKLIFERNNYGLGSSVACFVVIECLIFTLVIQRLFRGRERREQ